jgi:DNA-directed RNA polymerase specialized sigma24 family protein
MPDPSDSILIKRLKAGADPVAAQALWTRYFDRLAALARRRLSERTRRVADEEDVALSAFDSFFRGVADGRFPLLADRDDLWRVLVMITERKAVDRVRRATADKRGGGEVRGDSVFVRPDDSSLTSGMDQIPGGEPDPEFAALFADECRRLLERLGDPELSRLALLKLEGYTNEEIATQLGRAVRSVQRKLETIRKIWEQASAEDSA